MTINRRPSLPPEQDKQLESWLEKSYAAWDSNDPDQALGWATKVWDALPEPKYGWDYFPETVGIQTATDAAQHGRPQEARVFLRIARQAYGGDNAEPGTKAHLDCIQGFIEYETGNLDLAYEIFDAVATAEGRRYFKNAKPDYWTFYQQRKKQATGRPTEPLLPPADRHTGNPQHLSPADDDRVHQLIAKADALDDQHKFTESEPLWLEALSLLPDPKGDHASSMWIYGALGDDYWQQHRLDLAEDALRQALLSTGGIDNPFIWLRLGQTLHDQHGPTDETIDALLRAYMLDRETVFESEDPRYLQILKDRGLTTNHT